MPPNQRIVQNWNWRGEEGGEEARYDGVMVVFQRIPVRMTTNGIGIPLVVEPEEDLVCAGHTEAQPQVLSTGKSNCEILDADTGIADLDRTIL